MFGFPGICNAGKRNRSALCNAGVYHRYGGFLCELGLFSLPILVSISAVMAKTFEKKFSRVAYFILVTALLLNNTQIGNPLLLFVLGMNVALPKKETAKIGSDKSGEGKDEIAEQTTENGGAEA